MGFLQSMSSWFTIITITAAEPLMCKAKTFLEHFMGICIYRRIYNSLICFRMFDGEDSKVLHIGCWTHCRRLWVDALPSDRTAMDIIDPIGDMFRNEDLFRTMKLSGEQIKEKDFYFIG